MRKFAVVVLVVMTAVSCGKSHDTAVQVDTNVDAHALAIAADHTTQAGTGKVHLTLEESFMTGPDDQSGGGGPYTQTVGDGEYDSANDLSSMTMSIRIPQGLGVATFGGPHSTSTDASGDFIQPLNKIVQHGQVLYTKWMMGSDGSDGSDWSDKWATVDLDKVRDAGITEGSMTPLQGWNPMGDPTTILAYLKGAGADVTTVGHETVGGVDTTHVHATLSLQQAVDAGGPGGAKVAESLKNLPDGQDLSRTAIPVDVFVDRDQYVRRISLTYDSGSADVTGGTTNDTAIPMSVKLTADYSDFGQPVNITVPPADQTVSMCDALTSATDPQFTIPPGVC